MKDIIKNILRDEQGQDLVEYTLLIALVALAAAGLMTGFKDSIGNVFSRVGTQLNSAGVASSGT